MYNVHLRWLKDPAKALTRLGSDPEGVRIMEPKFRSYTLHATGLQVAAANILKQEMLAIGGEAAIARGTVNCSVDKSDTILHATLKQYRSLVKKLAIQPFGLRELAEEIDHVLETMENGPKVFTVGGISIPPKCPLVMGILNVTPDSFSDGGQYYSTENAVERALAMVEEGAGIIDIGAESTRPGSEPVSAEEEWRRLEPVLKALQGKALISVDTTKGAVARNALVSGALIINDVSAGSDPELLRAVAEHDAVLVLMHMLGEPRTMQDDPQYEDVVAEVCTFLQERAEKAKAAGVKKIILDPGIGFGKTTRHNLELLWNTESIRSVGYPVLIGASRKSVIGNALDLPVEERLEASLAIHSIAVAKGADIVRVHDVKETRRAVDMAQAMREYSSY